MVPRLYSGCFDKSQPPENIVAPGLGFGTT
uniref:Uncharacterized protein n=1 Tax=Anguilla anguilla TaxID=7936 RepID=A0A0E9W382_ANGAN